MSLMLDYCINNEHDMECIVNAPTLISVTRFSVRVISLCQQSVKIDNTRTNTYLCLK